MTTTTAPPGLTAVMAPHQRRSRQVKILFTEAEHELLSRFAAAAGTPPAYLARSLVFGGLNALLQQEDATGCVSTQETAPCNEPRTLLSENPGPLMSNNNPDPARGAGSLPRRDGASMDNLTAEAGRCCAHRTDSAASHATAL